MFPVTTMLVWAVLLLIPQGTDVVRAVLERISTLHSVGDLVYLWVSSGLLGLSLWYSMRWLIISELPALHFTRPLSSFWRDWTPRAAGAYAPLLVALILAPPDSFPGVPAEIRLAAAAAFIALAIGLLVFFWKRKAFISSPGRKAPGRSMDGSPDILPKDEHLPKGTVGVIGWSLVLTALLAVLFALFALTAPRVVGAAAVGAIALASINLFGSFILTWLPMRNALPPLGPWVMFWAILISPLTDNHGGKIIGASDASHPISNIAVAPTPVSTFNEWAKKGLAPEDKSPIYIVAAEGGGMRAAYWTASVLEAFEDADPTFSRHVFALSGVSGGSVGASAWVASKRASLCSGAPVGQEAKTPTATDMLSADFVSPALAGLFYYDLAQRFIPIPFTKFDRSRGLEEGMERAGYRLPGRPFEMTMAQLYDGCPQLPELLLNATVVETGQRAILSQLNTRNFDDAFQLTDPNVKVPTPVGNGSVVTSNMLSLSRQTLAQLTHDSARFPLISPPASVRTLPVANAGIGDRAQELWLPNIRMRLGDGGYFENSGLLTALELAQQINGSNPSIPAAEQLNGRTLKLIVITSDDAVSQLCMSPSGMVTCHDPGHLPVGSAPSVFRWMHEAVPIIEALYQVRDSRLHIAAAQAVKGFNREVIMMPMMNSSDKLKAPLGWALSAKVRLDLFCNAYTVLNTRRGAVQPVKSPPECINAK
ncbi:MAG: hypothetical protein M3N82_02845 [Pseudomonadota bacterium]|nr:hypothetical protein [Pseudomonadota bacterium]